MNKYNSGFKTSQSSYKIPKATNYNANRIPKPTQEEMRSAQLAREAEEQSIRQEITEFPHLKFEIRQREKWKEYCRLTVIPLQNFYSNLVKKIKFANSTFLHFVLLICCLMANQKVHSNTIRCQPGQVTEDYLKNNFNVTLAYNSVLKSCLLKNENSQSVVPVTLLRSLKLSGQKYFLYADNQNFNTDILPEDCFSSCTDVNLSTNHNSNYIQELIKSSESPYVLQSDGAKHEVNLKKNVYLTIDLCPSHKSLDLELFKKIQGAQKPVPVAISMSGYWLINHSDDFKTLLKMQKDDLITITWVNHSYSHPYTPGLSNPHNFLLSNGVNLEDEIFKNEKLFLENGIIPSVFFRFPGLVSNEQDIEKIRSWGLIPLAADAWLANGQKPTMGSFILVHANGNEPQGLTDLYQLLVQWPELKSLFAKINQAFMLN